MSSLAVIGASSARAVDMIKGRGGTTSTSSDLPTSPTDTRFPTEAQLTDAFA